MVVAFVNVNAEVNVVVNCEINIVEKPSFFC